MELTDSKVVTRFSKFLKIAREVLYSRANRDFLNPEQVVEKLSFSVFTKMFSSRLIERRRE